MCQGLCPVFAPLLHSRTNISLVHPCPIELSDEIDNLLVVMLICISMNAYSKRDDLGAVAPAAYHFTSWQERKQDIVLTTSIDVHFIKLAQTSQGLIHHPSLIYFSSLVRSLLHRLG